MRGNGVFGEALAKVGGGVMRCKTRRRHPRSGRSSESRRFPGTPLGKSLTMQPLPGSVSPPDFPGVRGGITLLRSCFETLEAFWTLLMPKEDSHLNCISEKVYVQSLERFGSHSFADWRWHTLRACVKACMGLQHFRTFWDPSLFANSKDKVLMTAVAQVSSSDKFWVELQFMDELTRTLNGSRTWCSGCACHEDLRLQGIIPAKHP